MGVVVMESLFLFIFLLLIILIPIANSTRATPTTNKYNVQNPTPFAFEFIKHLEGCQKGNVTQGLAQLKHYLHQFGYLHATATIDFDDVFDDALESAIRTYQENYNITPTGTLDAITAQTMALPRCGVPDIVNGVNTMQSNYNHDHDHDHGHPKSIHTVAHYAFFPNYPRWYKTELTYRFLPGTPSDAATAAARAFQIWASATQFSFSQVDDGEEADLKIGYFSGNHGDGYPFDGRRGILAHAFGPADGRFHYDADEVWSIQPNPMAIHLESVALHEIGHLLGLGHSRVQGAIMQPGIAPGEVKLELQKDDLYGIMALYGNQN